MLRHWLRSLTICTLLALALGPACQQQPAPATPDIPATVTAQFERYIESRPTPAPLATSTPYPTATVYPTATAYPTTTALPTYTPYPTHTPFPTIAAATPGPLPTPVLFDLDTLPVKGDDDLYDLGFGQLMFLDLPEHNDPGVFSPLPFRVIFVLPPGREWEDREPWSLEYVQVKCAEYVVGEEPEESGYECVIVE